jgi:hypothetical protein
MVQARRPESLLRETWAAYVEHGEVTAAAARSMGKPVETVRCILKECREKGYHLSDGARGAVQNAGLSGAEAKAGWIVNVDPETGSRQSTYWRAPESGTESIIDQMRSAFEGITPAVIIPAPEYSNADLLSVYPIPDAHVGLQSWGKETGEDYDTEKATDRIKSWVAQCVASAPPSETAIILGVGDLTHADDQTNQTPRSKHQLDVDTRHFKTLDMTIAAMAAAIETAAVKHRRVIVRILPGNHDTTTYMAVLFALAERYRDNARIEVQKIPGEFFAHQFGKVLIAAHHGDKAKAERLVLFMADQFPTMWGETRHRFLYTGHLHHLKSQDIGGVQHEQLRAITARDAYAVAHGYTARAQMQTIVFHREKGEIMRVKVNC